MSAAQWLAPIRPTPDASFRLYCFPSACAGPPMFHHFGQRLPDAIEPIGIRAPGRESRWAEPPFTDARALVEALVEEAGEQLVPPYAFLGGCSGALLAFGAARCLRRRGLPGPRLLVVLSHGAPDAAVPPPTAEDPIDRLMHMGWTMEAAASHPYLLRLVRRLAEAEFAMFDTYTFVPEAPLDVPISALLGRGDEGLTPADLLEWRAHTTDEFTLHWIDGAHHLLETNVEAVVRAVHADLRALP